MIDAHMNRLTRFIIRYLYKILLSVKTNFIQRVFVARVGLWFMRVVFRNKPVPIGIVMFLRKIAQGEDVLFPNVHAVITSGRDLNNNFLSRQLMGAELGAWSLTADTLNFLEHQIRLFRPNLILEFGSGVSTACFARYMKELHGDGDHVYVFSVEQDAEFVQQTQQLLETLGLDKYCRIIHAPLSKKVIEGIQTTCYNLNDEILEEVLDGCRPDFVLIDGPAGKTGARFGTLPLIIRFLRPGARFFLDDALRDGELKIVQLWSQIFPEVEIQGIVLIGKGLLIGRIQGNI